MYWHPARKGLTSDRLRDNMCGRRDNMKTLYSLFTGHLSGHLLHFQFTSPARLHEYNTHTIHNIVPRHANLKVTMRSPHWYCFLNLESL